jgi:hypothetical protein
MWAPHHIRPALDPRFSVLEYADHPAADRAPELLRDLIRYGHGERGLRLGLTDESLAEVDRHADAFKAAVHRWNEELA